MSRTARPSSSRNAVRSRSSGPAPAESRRARWWACRRSATMAFRERGGDEHALPLSARQLAGVVVAVTPRRIGQRHPLEQRSLRASLPAADAAMRTHGLRDLLADRNRRGAPSSVPGRPGRYGRRDLLQLALGHPLQVLPSRRISPRCRPAGSREPKQRQRRGALARSRLAHQADGFAAFDREATSRAPLDPSSAPAGNSTWRSRTSSRGGSDIPIQALRVFAGQLAKNFTVSARP